MAIPRFTLSMSLDSDAFTTEPRLEVARILRHVANDILSFPNKVPDVHVSVYDTNGNICGTWQLESEIRAAIREQDAANNRTIPGYVRA